MVDASISSALPVYMSMLEYISFETYDNICERLILIEPLTRTFQSEEYVSENCYALYAPIYWLCLLTGLEGGCLKMAGWVLIKSIVELRVSGYLLNLFNPIFTLFYNDTCLKIRYWRRNKHRWLCGS
jgi:hypothetical protein